MAANNIPNLLSYPATLGKDVAQGQHYLLIDSYESSSAVDKEGTGTRMSSIALYIPPQAMSTTIGQNYESLAGGSRLAAFGSAATATSALIDSMTSAVTKPKIVDDFRSASLGMARNAHMALVYRGPQAFREHPFTFDFWPKDESEAAIVKNIINDFKQGSTPRLGATFGSANKLTAPYFHSPRQWEIKFCKGKNIEAERQARSASDMVSQSVGTNSYIFRINRSVITSMVINHDPDGVVGFHEDGSPVHSRLTVTFQETQYVTSSDELSEELKAQNDDLNKVDQRRAVSAHAATGSGNPMGYK